MLKFFLIYLVFTMGLGICAAGIQGLYTGKPRWAIHACCGGLAYMILATVLVYQHT